MPFWVLTLLNLCFGRFVICCLQFTDFPSQLFYQVSIQISRQLKDRVNEHQFLEETSLLAGELLEEIFPPPQPSEKTLHIVVRPPSDCESFFFIILHSPHCVRLLLLLCHRRRFAFASCVDLLFALSATITASRSSDSNLAAYSK